jgi:hypothetical protein
MSGTPRGETVTADTKKNVTATPQWDGKDLNSEDAGKMRQKTPPTLAVSYAFLLVGLLCFLLSIFAVAFMVMEKLDEKIKLSWQLVFLPLWISNALVVCCHIGALVTAIFVTNTVRNKYTSEHFPPVFKNMRELAYWTTCDSFFGIFPSLLSLAFLWWLEGSMYTFFEKKQKFHFSLLLPLFALFAFSILREILGGKGSTLSAILLICTTITLVLVCGKAEGTYFPKLSWGLAFSPLVFVLCCFVLQILWVMYNNASWGKNGEGGGVCAFTSGVQKLAAFLYLVGSSVTLFGVFRFANTLPAVGNPAPAVVAGQAVKVSTIPLLGLSVIALGMFANACQYTNDLVNNLDDPTRVPGQDVTRGDGSARRAIDFNDADDSEALLGEDQNRAKKPIMGEEDWYYYGRMKVLNRDRWSGLTRPKIGDRRGCGFCGRALDKMFGMDR